MKHYTYKLTLKSDPRYYYFGVHRTNKEPEYDGYFGSGNGVRELKILHGLDCFSKEVLEVFSTRKEALLAEEKLVGDLWKTDPFCINRMPGGAFKQAFDVTGLVTYHKGTKVKYIHPSVTGSFEKQGWLPGIPDRHRWELRNYVTYTKDGQEKRILPEDISSFEAAGWVKGRAEKALAELRNRVHITDGLHSRSVPSERLSEFLGKGWWKGHASSHTAKSAEWNRNSVFIHKDGKSTKIQLEDLDAYIADGWKRGNLAARKSRTEEQRERSKVTQKGRIWINNGERCEKIWPKEFEQFQKEGWQRGRLKGQTPLTKGYVWIHNEEECRTIPNSDLDIYLQQGWQKGKGFSSRKKGSKASVKSKKFEYKRVSE